MRLRLLFAPVLAAMMISLPAGLSQDVPKKNGGPETAPPPREKTGPVTPKAPSELRKYEDVITKEAKSQKGVFDVHQVGDKYYLELPATALERLMLWQAEVSKGTGGSSWGGATLGSEVIKFERRGNKIYLWKVGFRKRAEGAAIKESVAAASTDSIIAVFPVEAEGKDKSAVISVTNVFMRGLPDLPITGAAGGGGSIDESRSYIAAVKALPMNIEAETLLTFSGGGGFGGFGGPAPKGGGGGSGSKTALVHQSFVVLPEKPMQGRFFDPRVGYFTESFESYDSAKPWTVNHQFITRYRLEKKDPNAAVSEVVKPITFYIGREVPEKWKPYLKKGVEDWNSAFEKAGFKNAIVCKYAPTREEDPHWDAEDARWSVIRWVAEPVANAMGPHVHDPRSGEIISAHIIFWHDVVKLSQMWYFLQVGANDPRAQKLPLPDDLTGDLLRYITTHEVGHSIGLRHNHRASQAYSISQLRDPEFMAKAGPVASIMSYGRFNYVAQPGDGVKNYIPVVGPYDDFAIHWGYAPIKGVKNAEDEKKTLDEWAAEQIKNPFLRFGGEDGPTSVDPTVLTENIGSDPIEATALGLKNLDRVLGFMLNATTEKGEDYALLEEVYKNLIAHRRNWFGAVAKQVGGVVEFRTLGQRGDETFVRVPKEKQKEAVRFLLATLFTTPTKLLDPKVVNQFKYNGVANDIMSQQKATLTSLLGGSRLNRLFDAEVMGADKAYSVVELVTDLQEGIFSELKDAAPKVDPIRRNLQRAYVEILKKEFDGDAATGGGTPPGLPRGIPLFDDGGGRVSELRAVARISLSKLAKQIEAAEPKTKDVATAAHFEDTLSEIKSILDAKKK